MSRYRIPTTYTEATFIRRINRFVSEVAMEGRTTRVYTPNTGRLSELAIAGKKVLLSPLQGKYRHRLLYILHNDFPVMIDSGYSNTLFRDLLMKKMVPGLIDYELVRSEPSYERHRFDFLMRDSQGRQAYVELKSCTLAWKNVASFPDAVSSRATEHVRLLAGTGTGVLVVLILHSNIRVFVPNYHTDFAFYRALREMAGRITILAYSVEYDAGLNITGLKKVEVALPEVEPTGSYILIMHNSRKQKISVGKLGEITFPAGYYLYVGSGGKDVFKRISYHRRAKRALHWHIDYLSGRMKIAADIPIVTSEDRECELSREILKLGGRPVENFGSSDCRCPGHLYFFDDNIAGTDRFWEMVNEKRFGGYQYR